ncbi:MAG: glycosyl transferase family 1 [Mucilaginibacter sp.]|nr:glycosyl transferase family 1 [Mucilaginibacter sp.]
MKLKIAILGTRGIPNHYGGFEHISEYVSAGLVERGHTVTVYNSHNHPYAKDNWNGVNIIHCYDPEYLIGSAGQFVYDLNCIRDARKRDFDVILIMGYTSSSVWGRLYPKQSAIVTNMDGLEWKRSKYSKPVQNFLKYAEKLAVKHSQYYVSDSIVIKQYLARKYDINSRYIPYGADMITPLEREQITPAEAAKEDYFLLMARMEPENNIETILDGYNLSNSVKPFKVLGDTGNRFGKFITHKFQNDSRIEFKGSIFDTAKVRALQNNSYLYFHGHSVGGTNPSLLEAMASEALIAAHNNPFNQAVLNTDAFYFSNPADVKQLVENVQRQETEKVMVNNNLQKIKHLFNWGSVVDGYEQYAIECYLNYNNGRIIS